MLVRSTERTLHIPPTGLNYLPAKFSKSPWRTIVQIINRADTEARGLYKCVKMENFSVPVITQVKVDMTASLLEFILVYL